MKSVIFSLAALTAAVSAQTSSACAAQPILEQCLVTTQGYLELCTSTDYACLCDKYTSIMTCFNNCPSDSRQYGVSQQKQLNCMNASIYSSLSAATATSTGTSSGTATAATTTGNAASTHASATTGTSGSTGTSTSTSSASSSSQSNAAGELAAGASGMFAALAAVAALM